MKMISRKEFLKRFSIGAALITIGTTISKTNANAMVNDNLGEPIQNNMLDPHPVGSVINSTVCSTMEQVIKLYGGKRWIQHSDYILRGAKSGVSINKLSSDGGQDTITPSGTNSGGAVQGHKLTIDEMPSHTHSMKWWRKKGAFSDTTGTVHWADPGGAYEECKTNATGGNAAHSHGFTQPKFTGNAHTNLPKYKNVYIWERVE